MSERPAERTRPHTAFVVIGAVLAVAAAALLRTALTDGGADERVVRETTPPPQYEIADACGRPLARSVQRLDLVMSPNAMWQAHTPEVMAKAISEASGGRASAEDLLACMFPDAAPEGFVRVTAPTLSAEEAARVQRWAQSGRIDDDVDDPPLAGLWVEPRGSRFELCWDPIVVLSKATRAERGMARYPQSWSRRLASRLARCLWGELPHGAAPEEVVERRERVWSFLMPTRHHVVMRDFDASFAPQLWRTLVDQGVASHQMRIERAADRVRVADDVDVLGVWGYLDEPEARARARRRLGLLEHSPVPAGLRDRLERATDEILSARWPRSGLELAAARLLDDCPELAPRPSEYLYRLDRPARRRSRSHFLSSRDASAAPRVVTTLDLALERRVHELVGAALREHRAAVAMAIVVDVPTGDVLAVDGQSAYHTWGFLPLVHLFTPGSTFKVLSMAAALEEGVVQPDETLDVGSGPLPLTNPRTGRLSRTIKEAESARNGVLTAAECVAYSSNRGMTLIGLRVPDTAFRGYLERLGYGRAPGAGLGPERGGTLPALPWSQNFTHASISFGHEILVDLWQHAAALVAVVRGGQYRPLRILRAVEHEGTTWELPLAPPQRVFSRRTAAEVCDMMRLGAREGTGASVARPELLPGLDVGTKTGTAEKVRSEVCLHAELAHRETCERCTEACRAQLVGVRPGHRSCYTSSMAIFGADPESGRQVFVLVVVDEPRGHEKYGSRVAGPTAVAILREALGRTRGGNAPVAEIAPGFAPSLLVSHNPSLRPWAEGEW